MDRQTDGWTDGGQTYSLIMINCNLFIMKNISLKYEKIKKEKSPFIMLCLESIGMDCVISESGYKGDNFYKGIIGK